MIRVHDFRFVGLFAQIVLAQVALAQTAPDQIRLAPREVSKKQETGRWYPRPLTTVSGTVQRFDSEQLSVLLTGQSTPTRFAARRVLEIRHANLPSDQTAAIESFRKENYSEALSALIRSISDHDAQSRPPVWRQQWLSMLAAQAATKSARAEIAIELVEQLDARPMPPSVVALLPIDWTGKVGGNPVMIEAAAKRASSQSMAVKLVVASWLLRSTKYQSPAQAALVRLAAQEERPLIAALAAQVLWRTKTPPELRDEIDAWDAEIAKLPMVLQTGPRVSRWHQVRQAGMQAETKRAELALELAPPTWHPDLP